MAVDGVTGAAATTATGTTGVGIPNYLTNDKDPGFELETLLRGTFDFCESPEAVTTLVAQISAGLQAAGLDTAGPLMNFVNALGNEAKVRLGDATAVAATDAVQPTLAGADLAKELEVLLYGAYASCSTPEQVANLTSEVTRALGRASLDTTGPLMDFIGLLGGVANQYFAYQTQQAEQAAAAAATAAANAVTSGAGSW